MRPLNNRDFGASVFLGTVTGAKVYLPSWGKGDRGWHLVTSNKSSKLSTSDRDHQGFE